MALNNEFKVKNDLNTLGRILSGGVDIRTIFSPSNTSWTLSANNGTFGVAGGDTLSVQGGNGVDVRVAAGTDTVRVSGIDATTSVKGVASFNSASFAVTNGDVTIKSSGVSNAQLSGSITDNKLSTISTAGKVLNSATTATSANTANAIVARGASGEFSSGSITATGNLSASGTVTGNAVVASNITATNLLSAANTFTRQLSVGNVQVRTVGTSNVFLGDSTTGRVATTGNHNFAFGLSAGNALTSGSNNVFIGKCAGRVNTTGGCNNFLGYKAGFSNTTGYSNNFLGRGAGYSNTTGYSNNFLGYKAGFSNTTGGANNFLGNYAGRYNTTGGANNFFGSSAGRYNTTGDFNNFLGNYAGRNNTEGGHNNFLGFYAGRNNTTGGYNNFLGFRAGYTNTTGGSNNFSGFRAGFSNTTGSCNNFIGYRAGCTNTIGSNNTIIGNAANVATNSLSGVIVLGTGAIATESHQIVLSTANVVFKNTGSTFEIGTPSLTDNLTVFGAVSSTGIVNTNTGFRISNAATSGHVLRGNGTNFISSTLAASDIASGQALTKTDDTNVTLTLGGSPSTALLTAASITLGWSGQLALSRGGTNASTAQGAINNLAGATTSGYYLRGNGTNVVMSPISAADVPTLNQNTTGSAATLSATRTLWGQNFNGSANVTGNLTSVGNITGSGAITIQPFATNQNINLTTSGTGRVQIGLVDISGGSINNTSIGFSSASTGKFTQVDVDNIQIDGNTISSTNANGNIVLAPNGTGDVQLDADTVRVGDSGVAATVTTNGAGNLTLNTNGGTNSGTITINQGINGNIDLTPNGTGEVNIPKVDIDGGTINGTTIGLTVPASGVFTGVSVTGNVNIAGNLFVAGSATRINTTDLIVKDPIIFLAEGNVGDVVDIGFTAAYNYDLTPHRHTGLIRNSTDGVWTLFSNLSAEILSAVDIPLTDPSVVIDTLRANVEGTLTGNVSGTALRANQFTTGKIISATGDISYSSGSFDGSANVTGTATINNNAVTYAKFQQVAARSVVGNPTGSTANAQAIPASVTGFALLSATNAAAAATTIGLGTTNTVTFGEVIVNNGTRSVLNDVYNTTVTSTNVATLATFATASYNSTKYTVQIKQGTTRRAALEIIATKDNGTWEGTVYGIIDQGNIFSNVEISVTGSTVDLVFTFNGNANYTVAAYAQAISD
jgi:hypothetical protein